jgi:hypothetical protein
VRTVISGGTGLERSSDAGESWTDVTQDSDHHAVAFSSSDSLIVYVGNDHGVRKGSYSSTESGTWAKTHNGLILTHYNGLGASGIGPNVIGGGTARASRKFSEGVIDSVLSRWQTIR